MQVSLCEIHMEPDTAVLEVLDNFCLLLALSSFFLSARGANKSDKHQISHLLLSRNVFGWMLLAVETLAVYLYAT